MKKSVCVLLALVMLCSPFFASYTSAQDESNEEKIYRFLRNELYLNEAEACGLLTCIYVESGFNPQAQADWGGNISYGLCQWMFGRYDALKEYCDKKGYDYKSLEGQLYYLRHELTNGEKAAYTSIRGSIENTADGAYLAGKLWSEKFERCAAVYVEYRATLCQNTFWPKYGNGSLPSENYTDIAEGTYYIKNLATEKYLTVESKNDLNSEDVTVTSHFEHDDYFRFIIKSAPVGYTAAAKFSGIGRVLNVHADYANNGDKVTIYRPTGSMSQWWRFEQTEGGYIIRSAQNKNCVLDTNGKKVLITYYTGAESQIWNLISEVVPDDPVIEINAGLPGENTHISWSAPAGADRYDLYVYDNVSRKYFVSTIVYGNSYDIILPAGSYTAKVVSVNSDLKGTGKYKSDGASVRFDCLNAHEHDFSGYTETVKEASCTAQGLKIIHCTDPTCTAYITESIPEFGHNYELTITEPTDTSVGYEMMICKTCGDCYITKVIPQIKVMTSDLLLLSREAVSGKTVSIPVVIENDSGITSLSFDVCCDEMLTFTGASISDYSVKSVSTADNHVSVEFNGTEKNGAVILLVFDVSESAQGSLSVSAENLSAFSMEGAVSLNISDCSVKISPVSDFYGDVNEDGSIDAKDMLIVRRYTSSIIGPMDINIEKADVDGNGSVDSKDFLYIRKYTAGLIDAFPAELTR